MTKFLNAIRLGTVFMNEGRRLVAGEAILIEVQSVAESRGELLEDLVRQNARLVFRIAYAVLRCHQDAEDATQETFLRVLRYGGKLSRLDDPKAWLTHIAWRVAVDRSRQVLRKREVALEDPDAALAEPASEAALADERLHGTQVGKLLQRLISGLPLKLRAPMLLSALEEMSPSEVAATLKITEAAVRSRVFRARQILREKMTGLSASKRR